MGWLLCVREMSNFDYIGKVTNSSYSNRETLRGTQKNAIIWQTWELPHGCKHTVNVNITIKPSINAMKLRYGRWIASSAFHWIIEKLAVFELNEWHTHTAQTKRDIYSAHYKNCLFTHCTKLMRRTGERERIDRKGDRDVVKETESANVRRTNM